MKKQWKGEGNEMNENGKLISIENDYFAIEL